MKPRQATSTRRSLPLPILLALFLSANVAHGATYTYSILMDTDVDLHGKDLSWVGRPKINNDDVVAAQVEFVGGGGGIFTAAQSLIQTGDTIGGQTVASPGAGLGGFNDALGVAAVATLDSSGVSIVTRNRIVAEHFPAINLLCGFSLYYSLGHPDMNNATDPDIVLPSGVTSGPADHYLFKVKASNSACSHFIGTGSVVDGETIVDFPNSAININDDGDYVVVASYGGGHGILLIDENLGSHSAHLVQKTGDTVSGRVLSSIFDPYLGETGEILFRGEFAGGGEGIISVSGPSPRGLLVEDGAEIGCRTIGSLTTLAPWAAQVNDTGDTAFVAGISGGGSGAFTLDSRILATGDLVAGAPVQSVDGLALGRSGAVALAVSFAGSRKAIVLATPTGSSVGCCGNGQPDPFEQCDDGNADDHDQCTNACSFAACGDGIIGPGETCDDDNVADSDGCSAACAVESGWVCGGEPSVCVPACGDGVVVGNEGCDDGNTAPGDGCSPVCECEGTCGDGSVNPVCEKCDLGMQNGAPGSSCTSTCQLRGACTGSATACVVAADCPPGEGCCGNGASEPGEQCDDGNLLGGDCCSATCQGEQSTTCSPSLCAELGIYGPHILSATEKLTLTDAKSDGSMERWSKTGDFNLFSGQSMNPSTERVVVAISENDGNNGRVELHRVTLQPTDCPPGAFCFVANGAASSWRYRDAKKLPDPANACGFETGTLRMTSGNKIKFQLKGKSDVADACAYDFPRPSGAILREDIVIGNECATVLLDCRVFGGNKTYRCVPRP